MNEFEIEFPMSNDYYTHLPLMKHLFQVAKVIKTGGSVLELGCGDGSSRFLKHVRDELDLSVTAFETDESWFNSMKEKYGDDKYTFIHINNWDEFTCDNLEEDHYELVFIDQSPWEARIDTAIKLKDKANYIVIHDYDYYIRELPELHQIILDNFKHVKYYEDIHPETILLSNVKDVDFDDIKWS